MDTRKGFTSIVKAGWGYQMERMESQSYKAQWVKRRVLWVLESQYLMKDLSGQSLKDHLYVSEGHNSFRSF